MVMLRKIVKIVLLMFVFVGCNPPGFVIKSLDDKFSDPHQPQVVVGQNNRLSFKSSDGGVHFDNKGVYVDPYILKDRKTGELISTGFYIHHFHDNFIYGFNPIKEIIILTDKGERIPLKVENKDLNIGTWYPNLKFLNTIYYESGVASIDIDDVKKLINAHWIEVKIVGGDRSQTYNKDEISENFLGNLKRFYSIQLNVK